MRPRRTYPLKRSYTRRPLKLRIDAKRPLREIKLHCHMDHDNIIKIKDIIPLLEKEKLNDVYIAYELMDISLHQIIRSSEALTDDHC
ncbi:hypothetical protein Gogos_010362 [Gossypium gossypioides]|uniref:Protein kinase domain-containing protein n=1 Tax=Gossypium gossypioides TaxID=34282 RepID=A0A7J9BL62_GOSGO|nr:hypothetical protein [Gossypium gossypioides]